MRLSLLICTLVLGGCAQNLSALPPFQAPIAPTTVDGGFGSQFGNYETIETRQMHQGSNGPCPISAWDRPISGGRVIRYLSAACPWPMPGRPEAVRIIDLGRVVLSARP